MILVDTSVWVDFFRAIDWAPARTLAKLLATDADLCICGVILTEVLQGIRQPVQYRQTKRLLDALIYLPTEREAYVLAATLYREARTSGRTVRKTIDCVIAACAIRHRVPILHHDADFDRLAAVSRLKVAGC